MFDEQNEVVKWKLDFIKKAMPAKSAVVFGDIYVVEGGYCKKCLDYGCDDVLLVDYTETENFQRLRIENPNLDFYKGDFANPHFMKSFEQQYDISVVFEILLHQPTLLGALHLMLEKTKKYFCFAQPMLREQALSNSVVYLPGNKNKELYPLAEMHGQYNVFSELNVNQNNWLWGLTPSFLRAALAGEGFKIIYENEHKPSVLTDAWMQWGCVAERVSENPNHWSKQRLVKGLEKAYW